MCDVKENIQYDPQPAADGDGTTCINTSYKAASTEPEEKSPSQIHENVHVVVNRKCNWKNIITIVYLWLTYLFINANYSLIGPLFPSEAAAKGCSSTITGVIIGSSPFCVILFSPLVGYFLSHMGLKFSLTSGIFLVGGTVILQGFLEWMPSGWIFALFGILVRMIEGVGLAMFITASFTLLPKLYPTRVGLVKGVFEVAGGIGYTIGPPLGGILYEVGGFKLPFITFGAITLMFVFVSLILTRNSKYTGIIKPLPFKLIWRLLCTLIIHILLIAHILSQAALSFFSPILQPFLIKEYSLNYVHIGLIFLCASVTYMIMSLVIGPISDLVGQRCFIITGFFLYGFGFFFIGPADFITSPHLWITCASYVVIGLGAAFGIVPFYAHLLAISKKIINFDQDTEALTGIVSGMVSFTVSLGHFIGPLVGGAMMEFFNFQTSALLVGEILLAESFLLLGVTLVDRIKCS